MSTEMGRVSGFDFTRYRAGPGRCAVQVSLFSEHVKLTPRQLRALAQACLKAADAAEHTSEYPHAFGMLGPVHG